LMQHLVHVLCQDLWTTSARSVWCPGAFSNFCSGRPALGNA
jgi:hypothetical protein